MCWPKELSGGVKCFFCWCVIFLGGRYLPVENNLEDEGVENNLEDEGVENNLEDGIADPAELDPMDMAMDTTKNIEDISN